MNDPARLAAAIVYEADAVTIAMGHAITREERQRLQGVANTLHEELRGIRETYPWMTLAHIREAGITAQPAKTDATTSIEAVDAILDLVAARSTRGQDQRC